MALPALIVAALARLRAANNDTYHHTRNPNGLGQGGHRQNLVPDFQAVCDIGQFVGDSVDEVTANLALTKEDARNTGLDRIAAAQSALAAAGSAGNAKTDADRAAASAAGVNLPPVTAANAGKALIVGQDGKYALGDSVPVDKSVTLAKLADSAKATASQIEASAGTGLMNVSDVVSVVDSFGAPIGGVVGLLRDPGARFLKADGRRYLKSAYPKLAAVMKPTIALGIEQRTITGISNAGYVTVDNEDSVLLGDILVFSVQVPSGGERALGRINLAQPTLPGQVMSWSNANNTPLRVGIKTSEASAAYFATGSGTIRLIETDGTTATARNIASVDSGVLMIVLLSSAGTWFKATTTSRLFRGPAVDNHGSAIAALPTGFIYGITEYAPGKIAVLVMQNSSTGEMWASEDDGLTWRRVASVSGPAIGQVQTTMFSHAGRPYFFSSSGTHEVNPLSGEIRLVGGAGNQRVHRLLGNALVYHPATADQRVITDDGVVRTGRSTVNSRDNVQGMITDARLSNRSVSVYKNAICVPNATTFTLYPLSYDPASELVLPISTDDSYVRVA